MNWRMKVSECDLQNSLNLLAEPGSYALQLQLDQALSLQVGRLGLAQLPPGIFIYLGSAWGPGGLRARLNRHIQGRGPLRWHIDTLRRQARVTGVVTLSGGADQPAAIGPQARRLECVWSQALAALNGAFYPVPGFGASDCRTGCPAHLVGFAVVPESLTDVLARAAGVATKRLQAWTIET